MRINQTKQGGEEMLGQLNKKMWYRLVSLVVTATFVFSNIATAGVVSTFKLRNNSAKANPATTTDAEQIFAIKNAIKAGVGKGDLIVTKQPSEGLFALLTAQGLNPLPYLLALNNGTAHGNNYDADGNLIETKMNLPGTDAISRILGYYGIRVVQHGITGTPIENIPALRKVGMRIGHVGTNWQNIAWEIIVQESKITHPELQDLVNRMVDDLIKTYGKKYEVTQREGANQKNLERLIGKELKNLLGKYQQEWENLPPDVKEKIDIATEKSATEHMIAFGSAGTDALVDDYLKSGLIVPVQKSSVFKIGYEPVKPLVDDFSLQITGATAAVLTVKGLRGKAQNLVVEKESLEKEVKELSKEKEKNKELISVKESRIKQLKDVEIQAIKNEADKVAKEIFQEVVDREKIILIARVAEGFGRDALKDSFKAGDVIIPTSLKNQEAEIIKAAMEGLDEYTSPTGEKYRIQYGIMDVTEGTNPLVDNVKGKTTAELKESEAGATSIMLYGPGVKKFMYNTLDAYIDQIVTHVPPEKMIEFIANPLDPELTADGDVGKIEDMLSRIAKANNLEKGINDLEVVIMDRSREAARIAAIKKLQEKYTGLTLTTIKDGTVAHGIDATLGIKTRGKHKVVMTVVGAPEGEYNRAIASVYKAEGALVVNRLVSENVNKDSEGKEAKDLKRRYAFGIVPKEGEEESEVDAIKKAYPKQWQDIVAGKILFLHSEIGASIRGAMAYITNNGVFRMDGVKETGQGSEVNFLRFGWVNGRPCAWFETRLIDNNGVILDSVKPEPFIVPEGASYPGRIVLDALKDTDRIIMATNIRTPLSIDGIIRAAINTNSFVIFQQAMSELDYTYPGGFSFDNPKKFAELIKARAKALGFKNFVIKGDHVTVKADKEFLKDKEAQEEVAKLLNNILKEKDPVQRKAIFASKVKELKELSNPTQTQKNVLGALKSIEKAYKLVEVEVEAGFTEFALDASFMPMRLNALVSAFLATLIHQDSGVETEVGEIGGDENSTIADVLELLFGKRYLEKVSFKGGAKVSKLVKYGPAVPIMDAFSDDIDINVPDTVVEKNMRGDKAIPVVINYTTFVESGPDGVMALENVLKQLLEKQGKLLKKGELRKNNIKFIIDVPDKISTEEANKLVDKFFVKVNDINGDFTNLNRDMFASIVVGKNPANVVNIVKEKFGTGIAVVIGSQGYIEQFKGSSENMIALGETKEKGQTVSMAKALKLALNLISEGTLTNDKLTALDALFAQDSKGSFTVKSNAVILSIVDAVEEYKAEVAAAIAI